MSSSLKEKNTFYPFEREERSLIAQDDVWDCSEIWEAKLRTESREAVETITNLRVSTRRCTAFLFEFLCIQGRKFVV